MQHIIVMGVTGVGKTTTAKALAAKLDRVFADADEFHSPENIAKMSAGEALTDEDRRPWLEELHAWLDERTKAGEAVVMACSALRRSYRDRLVNGTAPVVFIELDAPVDIIQARFALRKGYYMPIELLPSQVSLLEGLDDDEPGFKIDAQGPPEIVVRRCIERLDEFAAVSVGEESATR